MVCAIEVIGCRGSSQRETSALAAMQRARLVANTSEVTLGASSLFSAQPFHNWPGCKVMLWVPARRERIYVHTTRTKLMSVLPTDWPSFLWGAACGGVGAFFISFFTKAGEAAADYLKGKLTTMPSDHDRVLFARFQREVAAEPTLRLFKVPDFEASFRRSDLQSLNTFVDTWDSVEKEFKDAKLEAAKSKLYLSAEMLATEIARLTVPVGNGTSSSVYSDNARREHGVDERPDWVREEARTLNVLAAAFALEYETFVRLCRERLKV